MYLFIYVMQYVCMNHRFFLSESYMYCIYVCLCHMLAVFLFPSHVPAGRGSDKTNDGGGCAGTSLPFNSRYLVSATIGVNVELQWPSWLPHSQPVSLSEAPINRLQWKDMTEGTILIEGDASSL